MSKAARQHAILQLVEQSSIGNQEELRRELARKNFKVTQATLSRDIHELGLVKTFDGYRFPTGPVTPVAADHVLPSAHRLIRELVTDVRQAQNMLVVKTAVGSAQPVAAAIDGEGWTEIVGTLAGDDTIFIATPDERSARVLATQIKGLVA